MKAKSMEQVDEVIRAIKRRTSESEYIPPLYKKLIKAENRISAHIQKKKIFIEKD